MKTIIFGIIAALIVGGFGGVLLMGNFSQNNSEGLVSEVPDS
jgi:hypothetical protein